MVMSATVIIPTTGSPDLLQAVQSVLNQSYPTDCYVVIDGKDNVVKTIELLGDLVENDRLHTAILPINVGANGFYGHRVYAAFTHLVNTDYVLYLDQDNWFKPTHVESCIKTIQDKKLDWCYSLRDIYENNTFICHDDCESLGKWQTYHGVNHVDTNSYCLKTEIAIKLASAWHGGWGQDRVFLATVSQYFKKYDCTNEYSVNYRVAGNAGSVTKEFFMNGNSIMNDKYNGDFPWRKKTLSSVPSQTITITS
jgi:glycosyltransferase involved in cell wall biosynthesis